MTSSQFGALPPPPPHYQHLKLTPQQRDEIRRRYANGESAATLAAEFGVTINTIRNNSDAREPGSHR